MRVVLHNLQNISKCVTNLEWIGYLYQLQFLHLVPMKCHLKWCMRNYNRSTSSPQNCTWTAWPQPKQKLAHCYKYRPYEYAVGCWITLEGLNRFDLSCHKKGNVNALVARIIAYLCLFTVLTSDFFNSWRKLWIYFLHFTKLLHEGLYSAKAKYVSLLRWRWR